MWGAKARRKFEWGYLTMCCCQGQNRNCCCRCCGNGFNTGNGGITTLPSFPELPVFPGGGTAANTRWPVYVSFPAFLWDTAGGEDEDSSLRLRLLPRLTALPPGRGGYLKQHPHSRKGPPGYTGRPFALRGALLRWRTEGNGLPRTSRRSHRPRSSRPPAPRRGRSPWYRHPGDSYRSALPGNAPAV